MKLSIWHLAWRALGRDLRAGEVRMLLLAVALAVAALTAVGFLADRIQGGLQRDAHQLLGGDAVVVSDQPTPPVLLAQAQALGLRVATSLSFPTMARASEGRGGESRLVALKAVEPGYPLRGQLSLRPEAGQVTPDAPGIPAPGQVWVDAAVLEALGLELGDALLLGDANFQIARVIAVESDRGAGFMNFAPRVMLRRADLAATHLVQPASRLSYRMAVATPPHLPTSLATRYVAMAEALIQSQELRGVRVESVQSGRPEMGQTLERAEKFLRLVALLAALLSAVAVALAARSFAARHLDDCALLRVLGLRQAQIAWGYVLEFFMIGLGGSVLGLALGYGVHHLFVALLAGLVHADLPAPTLGPVFMGLGMGLTLLLAFGLPPVLQIASVPPLRVLRRDVGQLRPLSLGVLALGVGGFAALLLLGSSDRTMGLIAVGGFAGAVLLFALLSALAVQLLRRAVNERTAPRWLVLATRQVAARPLHAVVQISSLSVGLLALLLLVLLRTDLISSWRQATPAQAPNRFVINVLPEQGPAFEQTLRAAGVTQYDWFPMIRGRLVGRNGQPLRVQDYTQDRAQRLMDREFNLSYTPALPEHNRVVAGRWQAGEAGAISVEEGIAKTLNLHLGDRLQFDVGGQLVEATITSLRHLDWTSMRANFFVLFPVADLGDLPVTYLSAFHAPPQAGFDRALVQQFPNITTVDMGATLAQIQAVLDQVIRAVEFLFAFSLATGLVVLFATVNASREERAREYAIMRALGARGSLLRQIQYTELAGVGFLAGTLAALVAMGVAWALAREVFEFEMQLNVWLPLIGAVVGAALALGAGWWGLREVLSRPALVTLRQARE